MVLMNAIAPSGICDVQQP